MTEQIPDPPDEEFHRDRREHAGAPARLDDDRLAGLAEEERVEAGIDDYDPDEVPPAADEPPAQDVTQTEEYLEERAEIRRERGDGELHVRNSTKKKSPRSRGGFGVRRSYFLNASGCALAQLRASRVSAIA